MPEIRPDDKKNCEREYLGSVPLNVVQQLRELSCMSSATSFTKDRCKTYSQEGVRNVHTNIHGVADVCQVDEVTPSTQ